MCVVISCICKFYTTVSACKYSHPFDGEVWSVHIKAIKINVTTIIRWHLYCTLIVSRLDVKVVEVSKGVVPTKWFSWFHCEWSIHRSLYHFVFLILWQKPLNFYYTVKYAIEAYPYFCHWILKWLHYICMDVCVSVYVLCASYQICSGRHIVCVCFHFTFWRINFATVKPWTL